MSAIDAYPGYDGVPLRELVDGARLTTTTTKGFHPEDRIDPYYEPIWSSARGGPDLIWRSRQQDQILRDFGLPIARLKRTKSRSIDDAMTTLSRRAAHIDTLATVNLWRMISGEQLAAMRGKAGLASYESESLSVLYDAGLIQRGRFCYVGEYLPGYPEVFRPTPDVPDQFPKMTYADWVTTTLGGSVINGHQFPRHNLLMTELSLRAAEICPIHSVLGEPVATWPRLFAPRLSPNPYRAADGLWLREDGLKVVVELVASTSPAAKTKIDQLTDLIARDTSESVVVVFVTAPDPSHERAGDLPRVIRRIIKQSSRSSMSRVMANVPSRIATVRWSDWFPGPGLVSREFIGLRARRCLDGESWSEVDLLDPYQVPFKGAGDAMTLKMFENVDLVRGQPHWMCRRPVDGDFAETILSRGMF